MPRASQASHHPRKPSITTPMQWLSRNNSKHASSESTGGLGQGAFVVRTPEDALRHTNVRVTFDAHGKQRTPQSIHSSPSGSPPLPPLPLPEEDEAEMLEETPKRPSKPTRVVPPAPSPTPSSSSSHSSRRPSMKSRSSTAVDEPPNVPPLPSHISLSGPVPPFSPLLLSSPPAPDTDQSKIIVSLETCTTTCKTTLSTLCSRPSYLAGYFSSLLRQGKNSQASSVYSTESAVEGAYHNHFNSPPSTPTSLHIFLDRPSTPYTHILTFLRTPATEYPTSLPRAVQLSSLTQSTPISTSAFNAKLEALLELRDECAYIGLESLHRLCADEIRQRVAHAPRMHTRGNSQGSIHTMMGPGLLPAVSNGPLSIHSQHGSLYSLHTLAEQVESVLAKNVNGRVSQSSDILDDEPALSTSSTSPSMPPVPTYPLKHHHTPSLVPTTTTHNSTRSPLNSPPPLNKTPSYARPTMHRKAESNMSLPLSARRAPTPVSTSTRSPDSKSLTQSRGHHSPSLSVGGLKRPLASPPAGWI